MRLIISAEAKKSETLEMMGTRLAFFRVNRSVAGPFLLSEVESIIQMSLFQRNVWKNGL